MFMLNLAAMAMIVSILGMVLYGTVQVILWDVSHKINLGMVLSSVVALLGTLGSCFGANVAPIGLSQALLITVLVLPWAMLYWRADRLNSRVLRIRISS